MTTTVKQKSQKKTGKAFLQVGQEGTPGTSKISVTDLNLFYGEKQALFGVSLDIEEKK